MVSDKRFLLELGRHIRGTRRTKKLSMEAAASKVSMNWRHWQKVEEGQLDMRITTLRRIGAALDLPATVLLESMPDEREPRPLPKRLAGRASRR
jgi:cytoskeletal protein RodZ